MLAFITLYFLIGVVYVTIKGIKLALSLSAMLAATFIWPVFIAKWICGFIEGCAAGYLDRNRK